MECNNNNELSISVVIASYNDADTLRQTVDSVLMQSLQPVEILVVDDAGPAPAAEILGVDYPTVRILRHETNKTLSGVRNTGFSETRGDAILFLDGDDILYSSFLEKTVQALAAEPEVGVCFSGFDRCSSETIDTGVIPASPAEFAPVFAGSGYAARLYLANTGLFICSFALFRRKHLQILSEEGPLFYEDLESSEDYEFFIRYLSKVNAVVLDVPLGIYRIQSGRLSQNLILSWSNRTKGLDRLLASPISQTWEARLLQAVRFHRNSALRKFARFMAQTGSLKRAMKLLCLDLVHHPNSKTLLLLIFMLFRLDSRSKYREQVDYRTTGTTLVRNATMPEP